MRGIWAVAVGVLAVTCFAPAASARCVRYVTESGAVTVRCSDGVRGHLDSDDLPPPSTNSSYHARGPSQRSRSDPLAAPAPRTPSSSLYQSGNSTGRSNDPAASALARGRGTGPSDQRPY
jgi:hypothetical protein